MDYQPHAQICPPTTHSRKPKNLHFSYSSSFNRKLVGNTSPAEGIHRYFTVQMWHRSISESFKGRSHTVLTEMACSQEWWQLSTDSSGDYSYGVAWILWEKLRQALDICQPDIQIGFPITDLHCCTQRSTLLTVILFINVDTLIFRELHSTLTY
jgi:hypothetical protein